MTGVDKLKCQFLLLKIFSSSPRSSLISNPDNSEQLSQGKRKFMWLNKIRQKFYNNLYSRVETFVLDMRLVFQNHREHHREKNSLNLGLQLEKQFEEDFQSIFAIRK
ncbi:nuclear body protein SP140-like protein [Talpa occidentalis]|uniref:nuclear body protein SP140-like protein n=1 Tax=Talpa occidentalis TaxID=50954 RepID=UPI00188ED928|nr:nuclear body protein SP140-like protein [Talpa occidentalis]